MPGYKFGGKTPAVEICFLFGKTIKLLLSDRVSVISFPGCGYFFLNRELFPIVRLHLYSVAFNSHLNFRVGQSPSPVRKFAQVPHLRVI